MRLGDDVATERSDGVSLEQQLKERSMSAETAMAILRGTAASLDAWHREGRVHSTLSLESLLVDHELAVVIVDSAAIAKPEGLRGCIAPEVLLGEPATAASDQFALGAIAHQLLAGERPFAAKSLAESLLCLFTGIWRSVEMPAIPGQEAFDRVFSPEPSHRFTSCRQFVETLERQVDDAARTPPATAATVAATAAPSIVYVAAPPGPWPRIAVRIAAALAVVAFALGVWSWSMQREMASVEAKRTAASTGPTGVLAENGRMKVCNSSAQPVRVRALGAGYWDAGGRLQTFSSTRAQREGWTVAPDSEQNLSAGGWDGAVLFYFLDIEQQGKQYILSGTWDGVQSGCLAIAPDQR